VVGALKLQQGEGMEEAILSTDSSAVWGARGSFGLVRFEASEAVGQNRNACLSFNQLHSFVSKRGAAQWLTSVPRTV